MVCKKCNGRGRLWSDDGQQYNMCPECIGGVSSCCDVDTETTGFIEPKLKGGKIKVETYEFKKEVSYVTGFEMTYNQVAPSPLVMMVTEMLLNEFAHMKILQ